MTTWLTIALGIALLVLAVTVIALLADSGRIARLERTLAVADQTIKQVTAERDEARRNLRQALDVQSDAYIRLRPGGQTRPGVGLRPYPQDRSADGVPDVTQNAQDEPTEQFTQIVERNTWPMWPDNGGRS